MIKVFSLLFTSIALSSVWAAEQLIVVVAPDMNSSVAVMQRYTIDNTWQKAGEPVSVTLGRSGLGWVKGSEILKYEGDGRSPAGVFEISKTFGYDQDSNSAMGYLYADERLICVDDVNDADYNKITFLNPLNPPKSYEVMRRSDEVYRHGAVIEYNAAGEKGRGSCIFIHLNHPDRRPTSGCTAMDEAALIELLRWLDPAKHPKILQIPKSECLKYQKEFAGIECE